MKTFAKTFQRLSTFVTCCIFHTNLWAQSAAEKSNLATGSPISTGSMVVQVLTALAMVTASIFILAWLMKRLGGQSLLQQRGMKMLATMPVGNREKIALVEVEGTRFLIGVATGNVNCLHVFSAEDSGENTSEQVVPNENDAHRELGFIHKGSSQEDSGHGSSSQNSLETPITKVQQKTEKWDFASAFKQLIKDGERK